MRSLSTEHCQEPLDFFVLMSSLTAQLGEFGQADYAAANAFLDAFAEARHAEGAPMMSIAWDAWRDNGMAARAARTAGLAEWEAQQRPLRISDEEGAEIFCQGDCGRRGAFGRLDARVGRENARGCGPG